jgi:hypothetical protein
MPTTYSCDHCGQTAASLSGWLMVSIQFIHDDPNVPFPPGGRMLDSTLPDLLFHTVDCRDAWCGEKGLVVA